MSRTNSTFGDVDVSVLCALTGPQVKAQTAIVRNIQVPTVADGPVRDRNLIVGKYCRGTGFVRMILFAGGRHPHALAERPAPTERSDTRGCSVWLPDRSL